MWLGTVLATIGFFVWSLLVEGNAARALALMCGVFIGVTLVLWSLGGHVSTFRWWLGAEGERDTGKEIERLGAEWHCEHDVVHGRGNWDHVLVGPPGVFLLDSKRLSGTSAAGDDKLACGRVAYSGSLFRSGAKAVKHHLDRRLGAKAPWVQAVVVIWGDFPHGATRGERRGVRAGRRSQGVARRAPPRVNAPQRAALVTALREVRTAVAAGTAPA